MMEFNEMIEKIGVLGLVNDSFKSDQSFRFLINLNLMSDNEDQLAEIYICLLKNFKYIGK